MPARRLAGRYALAGACCAGAAFIKLNCFLHALLLLALALLLDRNQTTDRRRLACGAAFMAGLSPFALQFVDVFLHSGRVWMFDEAYMTPFHYPERGLAIEAVVHAFPEPGAYTVRPAGPIGTTFHAGARMACELESWSGNCCRGDALRNAFTDLRRLRRAQGVLKQAGGPWHGRRR